MFASVFQYSHEKRHVCVLNLKIETKKQRTKIIMIKKRMAMGGSKIELEAFGDLLLSCFY